MILNLIFLLIGTCISIISGVEHIEPAGTAMGSEQLHAPCLSAEMCFGKAYHSIDQDSIGTRWGRGLIVSCVICLQHDSLPLDTLHQS